MSSELENYDIIQRIGCGQFGKVYEVKDKRDETSYALKIINLREDTSIRSSLQEVQALAKMDTHRNIVRYYHCWMVDTLNDSSNYDTLSVTSEPEHFDSEMTPYSDDESGFSKNTENSVESQDSDENYYIPTGNVLFIKTELCEMNLRTWMKEHLEFHCSVKGNRPILSLFSQVADAVMYIHDYEFVHRDLKPENIFVSRNQKKDWRFKVGDFGIVSKTLPQSPSGQSKGSKHCYGTLPYAAPELLRGEEFDGRADVYSMGVILLEILYRTTTTMELAKTVEAIKTGGQSTDTTLVQFLSAHSNEVSKLREMLSEDPIGRPTSRQFFIWLKSFSLPGDPVFKATVTCGPVCKTSCSIC